MKKWYLVDVQKYNIFCDEIVRKDGDPVDRDFARWYLLHNWELYKTRQEKKKYIDSNKWQDGDYIYSVCFAEYDQEAETIDFDSITDHIDVFDIPEK